MIRHSSVGPQDGFAAQKVAVEAVGVKSRSLGGRVLRAETGALAGVTLALAAREQMVPRA